MHIHKVTSHFLSTLSLFFLIGIIGCNSNLPDVNNQPNVILIMTDDQGWGDLSFHGNDSIFTPNIDALAERSARFDRFYVSPVCAPTRASLLTGRYHLRTGTSWVTHRKDVMRAQETTIAELLKQAGYATGCFGKWHNGEQYPNDPIGQGFDTFVGFKAGHWNNYFNTTLTHKDQAQEISGFITDVLTNAAIHFIEENQNHPFFCYIPYNAPHSPFQVPNKYFNKYKALGLTDKNASVYGMVENIDDNIGRVLSAVDSMQLMEETIIIFLTDNGPNGRRYNGKMRGIKGSVHEGGVRVPCFISWKGHLQENFDIPQIAAHIDILPTIADLCDIKSNNEAEIDGKTLVPLLGSTKPNWPDRYLYNIHTEGELRMYPSAVRSEQFRMVVDYAGDAHLYDLISDPSEEHDLTQEMPDRIQEMQDALLVWFDDVTKEGIQPPSIPIGHERKSKTDLPAPEAQLSGNLVFKGGRGWANDYIIQWKEPGDQAEWELEVQQEGTYQVQLIYHYPETSPETVFSIKSSMQQIDFEIKEPFHATQVPSPDRVVRGEVYEKIWGSYSVGSIELEEGKSSLKMILKDTPTNDLQLEVKEIELIRL